MCDDTQLKVRICSVVFGVGGKCVIKVDFEWRVRIVTVTDTEEIRVS